MAFDAADRQLVTKWNGEAPGDITIKLLRTEDERSSQFLSFCDELSSLAPVVQVISIIMTGEAGPPAILVGSTWKYHLIPTGTELVPFLEVLSSLSDRRPTVAESILALLQKAKLPIDLKVFVSPHCPFCPATVKRLIPLSAVSSPILITVIDALLFPEMADPYQIKSVPTVILNDTFRWTAQVRLEEILDALEREDPSKLGPETLVTMLKAGQAEDLALMMLERNKIFPVFVELIAHPEWSVRLGAMVVVEEIGELKRELAQELLEPLWDMFPHQEIAVKGDILYLIGQLGDEQWIPRLDSLQNSEHDEDVRTAAAEACAVVRRGL